MRSVTLEDGREIEADFFIDCSGFRKLIIGGAYEEEWISYAEHLLVNRALPFSVPHPEGASIPAYTHAWALSPAGSFRSPRRSGWAAATRTATPSSPPTRRRPRSKPPSATRIEPSGDIAIASGRRLWIKNCVAVGLSGAFSEPLESTSIHAQLVQLLTLVQEYLTDEFNFDAMPILDRYNRRMSRMYDDFRDFLVLHYQGGRDDSEFWRSISINDSARERLDLWKVKTPLSTDLDPYFGTIDMKLWLYTLDGLGLLDPAVARRELDYYSLWDDANRAHRAAAQARPLCPPRHPARRLPRGDRLGRRGTPSHSHDRAPAPPAAEAQPRRPPPPIPRPPLGRSPTATRLA